MNHPQHKAQKVNEQLVSGATDVSFIVAVSLLVLLSVLLLFFSLPTDRRERFVIFVFTDAFIVICTSIVLTNDALTESLPFSLKIFLNGLTNEDSNNHVSVNVAIKLTALETHQFS